MEAIKCFSFFLGSTVDSNKWEFKGLTIYKLNGYPNLPNKRPPDKKRENCFSKIQKNSKNL